jgi:predicted transcriptional regulator
MRQPKKFDADREITEKHICDECGGTGKRPAAVVFGAFVPTIEVVLSGREHEIVQEQIANFSHVTMAAVSKELERKCGTRRPGYYAVASAGKPSKRASVIAKDLQARRAVKGEVEVIGDFVLFAKPVKVGELKRFRGVKRFSLLSTDSEVRAEMSA